MTTQTKVLLYGDVTPNIVDGSSIWLVSMAETLSQIFDDVIVLLKDHPRDDRLHNRLRSLESVSIVLPPDDESVNCPLSARDAAKLVAQIASASPPDAIVLRGSEISFFAAMHPSVADKLWAYVTDLPFPLDRVSANALHRLGYIAKQAKRIFCQTEDARSYLEAISAQAAGKCVLLTPMIPDEFFGFRVDKKLPLAGSTGGAVAQFVYSGKFSKPWLTLEMLSLPAALQDVGLQSELTVIGDKFQADKGDKSWHRRMRQSLEDAQSDPSTHVSWQGGVDRSAALKVVAGAHFGLGWRSKDLNNSLEISTKLLEYCAVGTLPVVNRNSMHESLLGPDYPLLIDESTPVEVTRSLERFYQGHEYEKLQKFVISKARYYAVSASVERLRETFYRAGALSRSKREPLRVTPIAKTKIVVAGHDFKFMGELLGCLRSDARFDVRIDAWRTLREHDEEQSESMVEWADVILCEWCGPNAVWYAERKKDRQRLIVRLHRFEVNGPWMADLRTKAIDAMVYVSQRQKADSERLLPQLTDAKGLVISNMLDTTDLNRPKVSNAQFHLGLLGIVPFVKRPDRALDLLETLLESDNRYTLHLRGRMPWEYPHEWSKALQQQIYLDFFQRIRQSHKLQRHVVFEPFGADVGSWFRRIGVILSPSSFESFHLACAEGIASGALPIVWSRPGAEEIFGSDNVYPDLYSMATTIFGLRDASHFHKTQQLMSTGARKWDIATVYPTWVEILLGIADRPPLSNQIL